MDFAQLGLQQWLQKICTKINYKEPRPIQQLAIKPMLEGKNVLISSQTGTGKTAAFAFPILQTLSYDPYGIYAIVITANRELAMQIAEQFQIFGGSINLRLTLLIGGMPIQKQLGYLAEIPHIIVGTPGRCAQLLKIDENFQKYIKNTQYFVLDEVDRLMEPQVWRDVQYIQSHCTNPKLALASATITGLDAQIEELLPNCNFEVCAHNPEKRVSDTIKHKFILMPDLVKDYYFIYLLKKLEGAPTIIFTPTCRKCHEVNELLNYIGIVSTTLHSMLPQKERMDNLRNFRSQKINVLVATDVASRGLDIPSVKFVVNWNVPKVANDYIHRVGRTGRAGRRGTAITLMTQFDVEKVLSIESEIGVKLEEIKFIEEKVLEDMSTVVKAMKNIKLKMGQDGTTDRFIEMQQQKRKQKRSVVE